MRRDHAASAIVAGASGLVDPRDAFEKRRIGHELPRFSQWCYGSFTHAVVANATTTIEFGKAVKAAGGRGARGGAPAGHSSGTNNRAPAAVWAIRGKQPRCSRNQERRGKK